MNKVASLTYAALATLVIEGDVATIRSYLENRNINPDEADENGQTLLMLACQNGHLEVVKELIRQGAEINAEDLDNWTPLLNAAKEGHAEIVSKLLNAGASLEHRDMGGWTALMWACYKGHPQVVRILLERGASANVYDKNHASCLVWAAGRGHTEIVQDLLAFGAKLNYGDKYGTTPLVWACRRGYYDIVQELLRAGANVDFAGMYSWTALILATKGNHASVVSLLLEHKPNVNAVDMDGCTALTLACKEGFSEIAISLLNSGAYINLQDRNGDTNLIHATKAGHYTIVDALLKKYADVDVQGADGKTALYWAVEKGYVDIVRITLNANPNLEIATKDGDTPLMKATRSRNTDMVQMLIDKKAKVSATDRKGDTALHIAMRARSKAIVEVLLRNPKNSQLLYRPNRAGETPYNIDNSHQKNILAQIFGARRLNTNEDGENMLGYDLYSSALADILSEPSLSMPISVGLYAKWGSGKSFLLNKLEDEMRGFAFQWLEPTFEFSWLVFLIVFLISLSSGIVLVAATRNYIVGLSIGSGVFVFSLLILVLITYGSHRYDWAWAYNISVLMASQLSSLRTLLLVVFCNPPSVRRDLHTHPVRFLFTDQTKVSSSGGDMSIAQIIVSLYVAVEEQYGYMTSRLYRVFRPKPVSSHQWRWRRLCCIPNFLIALAVLACFIGGLILLLASELNQNLKPELHDENSKVIRPILIALACVVGVVFLSNLYTWLRMIVALVVSHQRRVQHHLAHVDASHTMGYLQALKTEVETMASMIQCLDAFINQQTRMVVIVDGLDSCEQEKVLRVLDAVHLLFSDPNAPFVTVLAIDPHIIITAIESNIHRVFHNSTISGHEYLRNIVHLPFYLQNSGLRRVKAAQQAAVQNAKRSTSYWNEERECDRAANAVPSNRKASNSSVSIPEVFRKGRKGNQKLKASESMASSISNLHRVVTGAQDLTKVLLTDDYFSDVNPRSMRRLMNIVYITGRLLKAFNIDFNWYHLASWINITEQWPYRTSWIILYYEMHENDLEEPMSLKSVYEKVKHYIPISREDSPMLDLDHDERKFEVFLSFHSSTLQINDLKVFLPFTINLDPYIRKAIQEEHQQLAEMLKTDHRLVSGPHPSHRPGSQLVEHPAVKWGQAPHHHHHHPYWQAYHSWKSAAVETRKPALRQEYPAPGPTPLPYYPTSWWDYRSEGILPLTTAVKPVTVSLPGNQKLSNLSVEGVIQLLSSLEGIDKTRVKEYNNVLRRNNITGQVLLTCDLNELKDVSRMSFGDWELFRMVILYLREKELQDLMLNGAHANSSYCSSSSSSSENHGTNHKRDAPASEQPDSKVKSESAGSSSRTTTTDGESRPQARSRSGSVVERQVTMEDSMIMGALETLNEEAQEDALEERLGVSRSENMSSCGITSNPLSPILSDPEEQVLEDHSDVNHIANTIIGSFASSPSEVDVLYLRSPRDSPMLHVKTLSLSDSATDVESISSGKNQMVFFPSDYPSSPTLDLRNGHATPSTGSTPSIKALYKSSCFPLLNGSLKSTVIRSESRELVNKNIKSSELLPQIATTSSLEKLPKPKSRFPSDNSLSEAKSEKIDISSHPSTLNKAASDNKMVQNDGGESDSSENSSSESTQSTENVLLLPKAAERKEANAATPQDDVDGFFSDDEHTPLVSPLHTSRPDNYYNPPTETNNNNSNESTSEKSPKQSRSEGSMLSVKRWPLERQYSMENNFCSQVPQTSASMTEIANSVPTSSPLGRQLSYNLTQGHRLTSFEQPVSDSTTPTEQAPFGQASSEPSGIPHIHNETVL